MGRDLAVHPEKYNADVRDGLPGNHREEKPDFSAEAGAYLYQGNDGAIPEGLGRGRGDRLQFVNRLYDLIEFENAAYAQKYLDRVLATLKKDSKAADYAATKAVVKYLAQGHGNQG